MFLFCTAQELMNKHETMVLEILYRFVCRFFFLQAVRDTQDLDYILVADCVYYDESLGILIVENYISINVTKEFSISNFNYLRKRLVRIRRTFFPSFPRKKKKLNDKKKSTEDLTKTIEGLSTSKTQERMHFYDDILCTE